MIRRLLGACAIGVVAHALGAPLWVLLFFGWHLAETESKR